MNVPSSRVLRAAGALLAVPILLIVARFGLAWPSGRAAPAPIRAAHTRPAPVSSARPHAHAQAAHPAAIVAYVAGAVRRPGLVTLAPGARVAAALARVGVRAEADLIAVNLAARVEDGEEIVVPLRGAAPTTPACSRRPAVGRPRGRHSPVPPSQPLSLNSADARQLARVPGIGARLAARIVAYRETYGAFGSVDDLLDIAGVTERTLERAAPYLHP